MVCVGAALMGLTAVHGFLATVGKHMRISLLLVLGLAVLLGGCSRKQDSAEQAKPASTPTPAAATAPAAPPPAPATPSTPVFSSEELDQMVAPIALYPDPLLAQVLMAATYPGEVADAVTWSKAHPEANGDAAVKQVADQSWDPSVQSLVAFPQALATLGQDPAWVQRLGDAFLAQPDQVMDAVQRLRRQAQSAGNLQSNQYQKISVQSDGGAAATPIAAGAVDTPVATDTQTIVIEPANPQVVYVPCYNPTTVYGTWAYPSYPPVYYPPPPSYYPVGTALATGLAFGVGLAITDSLWGGFDWHDDDYHVDIDVNRYNNINVNNRIDVNNNRWQHNAIHRDGVPYRDAGNRERYGRQLDGAGDRAGFRGEDAGRSQAREQARQHARSSMEQRGIDAPATSNREARERVQDANRQGARERVAAGDHAQARDRAAQADRGQARERAAQADRGQARDRAAQAQRDGAARERAGATADRRASAATPQQRDRAQAAARNRNEGNARVRQNQSNENARNQAQRQAAASRQAQPRNNAFQDAGRPQASRAAAQRGGASQAAGRQHAASAQRPAGRQVSRPANPPQRGGRR